MTQPSRIRTLTRLRPESCLSDLILDRFLLSELDGTDEYGRVSGHLETCGVCAARLDGLKAERVEFLQEHWRNQGRRRRRPFAAVAGGLGAVAAGLLVTVLSIGPGTPKRPTGPTVRTKGGLALDIVAKKRDGRVEQILPGSRLSPGAAIRFKISTKAEGYLTIAALDSAPAVSIYHPGPNGQEKVGPGRDQLLDGSITLDRTLGPEKIVAVLCDEPIAQEEIVRALNAALEEAGGDPRRVDRLPLDCGQTAFLYEKSEVR